AQAAPRHRDRARWRVDRIRPPERRPCAPARVAGGAEDGRAGDGRRGADPAHGSDRARRRRPRVVSPHEVGGARRARQRGQHCGGGQRHRHPPDVPWGRKSVAVELWESGTRWRNWGRAESANPVWVARPSTVDEVVAVVRRARELGLAVKAVGASHSFTGIAAADKVQLDLAGLDGLLTVDAATKRVTLGAGTNLYQLPALLAPHGLAMENLGDIDRQTIAGATSTGTHGTGGAFRGLAAQLVAATLVTADGEVLRVGDTENRELWPAVRLGLGALGILTDVTVQCVPAFALEAKERPESLDAVLDEFTGRVAAVDH